MDIIFLILFFIIIILLIIVMYLLLKRLIFRVNKQSISYFVEKMHSYDDIIEDKENKIKELDKVINEKEELSKKENNSESNNEKVFLYELGNPKYKDINIFKKMKEVDEKFDYDDEKIINEFIEKNFDNEMLIAYEKYNSIKKKFDNDKVFNLLLKREKEQIEETKKILGDSEEILDDFMRVNKTFNLKKFISYLNKIVNDLDPCIHIYVGRKNKNYNYINKYIETSYDKTIFKGLKIIYKNKLYDYSI